MAALPARLNILTKASSLNKINKNIFKLVKVKLVNKCWIFNGNLHWKWKQ